MREKFHQLQKDYEAQQSSLRTVGDQNNLLKTKAQQLLHQNEDYTRMVSELSRYYYRIKQGADKMKELVQILDIHDENIEGKLTRL